MMSGKPWEAKSWDNSARPRFIFFYHGSVWYLMMRELTSFLIYTKHGYVIRSTHPLVLVFIWGSQSKGCWLNGSHNDLKQFFSSVTKCKVTKYCYHIFCCYSYVVICFTKISPQGQIEKKKFFLVCAKSADFIWGTGKFLQQTTTLEEWTHEHCCYFYFILSTNCTQDRNNCIIVLTEHRLFADIYTDSILTQN